MTCTCFDALVLTTLCKRIHLVQIYRRAHDSSAATLPDGTTATSMTGLTSTEISDAGIAVNANEQTKLLDAVQLKTSAREEAKKCITNKLHSLMERVAKCESDEALKRTESAITSALKIEQIPPATTMPTSLLPGKRKVVPQHTFYSTKQKN